MPTKSQKMGGVIAFSASLIAISTPAQALTLFGNYPPTNDITATSIFPSGFKKAVGFTLPTGSDYSLDSITLRLADYDTTDGDVALVQIYRDSAKTSTNPNGATLETVTFNNPSSNSVTVGNFVFSPNGSFTFLADTRYWLLVDATAGDYFWQPSNPGITPTGISGIVNNGYQFSNDNGSTYSSSAIFNSFQIEVTPVPFEFNPALGLGIVGSLVAAKKLIKRLVKK
jgi:hypothetical protein